MREPDRIVEDLAAIGWVIDRNMELQARRVDRDGKILWCVAIALWAGLAAAWFFT